MDEKQIKRLEQVIKLIEDRQQQIINRVDAQNILLKTLLEEVKTMGQDPMEAVSNGKCANCRNKDIVFGVAPYCSVECAEAHEYDTQEAIATGN